MFTRQLPKSLISQDNQILLDKHEVEDLEHLKVDILANRGLSQLLEIDPHTKLADYPRTDARTAALLARGDVLGVTQGESPAMRRLFRAIQPTSVEDCVFATAMIRPVAMSGRQKAAMFQDWSQEVMQDSIVFEDDAIDIISSIIGVDMYEADMYRRAFAKKTMKRSWSLWKGWAITRASKALWRRFKNYQVSGYVELMQSISEDSSGHSPTKKRTIRKRSGEQT